MNNCLKHGTKRIAYDPQVGRYCAGCSAERSSLHDRKPWYVECRECGAVYDRYDHYSGGYNSCSYCGGI